MTTLAELERQVAGRAGGAEATIPPPRTMRLTPGDFAHTWVRAPQHDIVVGLRVYSESDARTAEAEAAKKSSPEEAHQTLLGIAVARGMCDPNNVAAPHPTFPLAEETVPMALTPRAIKRIFDEIERLHVEQSPVFAEATDEELTELCAVLLQQDPFAKLPPVAQGRARRFAKFVLDMVNETPSG